MIGPKHSTPINRMAGRVLQQGIHWEPRQNSLPKDYVHSREPLPKREAFDPIHRGMIGRKFGRLTVMWLGGKPGDDPSRYVCRCACGAYEHRSGKAICNPKNDRDACVECRLIARRKAADYYRQTGRRVEEVEFL